MILVVSHSADDHATAVLSALRQLPHPATLLDTAAFPSRASVTQRFHNGSRCLDFVTDSDGAIDLASCGAAWWRRPQPFTLPDGLSPDVATFAYTECQQAFSGLVASLDAVWVNPPELDELAHHKPFQLAMASRVGLDIPRTVITDDPSQASADVRVTVVGDHLFATAITPTPGGYDLDHRVDLPGQDLMPTELPADTAGKIRALMERLGLLYGAVDLRRTPDGRFVFLEVNPAGEWRFIEERTHQPITQAMAEFLARIDREGPP